MRSKTKIIVLHLKELIYTGILLVLGVGLLFLLLQTFLPKKAVSKPDYDAETSLYLPGKYTSTVQLGNDHADVEVVVDSSDILSIRLVNLSQTVTAMYPLVEPCMDTLAKQICEKQSLEGVTYPDENRYTSQLLLQAIDAALQKAAYHADGRRSDFADAGLLRRRPAQRFRSRRLIPAADPVPSAMPCGSHPKASEGLPWAIPQRFRPSVRPAGTNA